MNVTDLRSIRMPFLNRPAPLHTLVLIVLSAMLSAAQAQQQARRGAEDPNQLCGIIYTDHYGPFDYRTHRAELKIVEDFHFTPKVESLISGQSGYLGGDLNYTLRASPNHHRALLALMRHTERRKSDTTEGQSMPVECYFDRAIRFRPDDTVVRALYAQFLHKRKRSDEAERQLDVAVKLAGESAFSHYNLGLVYLEMNLPAKALAQAHTAAGMGFPRSGLKDALQKAGKWQEPPPSSAALAASAAPTAADPVAASASPSPATSASSASR